MTRKKSKGPKPGTLFKDVERTKVGMNITVMRRRRTMTQQELADKTGLDKSTISYYERKSVAIPLENLSKIATALTTTTDMLLNGKVDNVDLAVSKPLLKRLELAKTLPPEKQKLIVDLIDQLLK